MSDLRETVANAIAEALNESGIRCTPARSTVVAPVADAAIAAARPIIRAELFDELISVAQEASDRMDGASKAAWFGVADWITARKEADHA